MMSSTDDLWPFQRLGLLVSLNITIQKKKKKVKSVARNLEVSIRVFLFFRKMTIYWYVNFIVIIKDIFGELQLSGTTLSFSLIKFYCLFPLLNPCFLMSVPALPKWSALATGSIFSHLWWELQYNFSIPGG